MLERYASFYTLADSGGLNERQRCSTVGNFIRATDTCGHYLRLTSRMHSGQSPVHQQMAQSRQVGCQRVADRPQADCECTLPHAACMLPTTRTIIQHLDVPVLLGICAAALRLLPLLRGAAAAVGARCSHPADAGAELRPMQ